MKHTFEASLYVPLSLLIILASFFTFPKTYQTTVQLAHECIYAHKMSIGLLTYTQDRYLYSISTNPKKAIEVVIWSDDILKSLHDLLQGGE